MYREEAHYFGGILGVTGGWEAVDLGHAVPLALAAQAPSPSKKAVSYSPLFSASLASCI
jgi:hypothetical protein